jgi:Peptidase family S41
MQTPLLFAALSVSLLLSSVGRAETSPAPAQAAAPSNPADQDLFQRVQDRYKAVLKGISFYYYTQADRVQALQELFLAIDNQYAQLPLKKHRLQLDFDALKDNALAAEKAIPDTLDEAQQARSNIEFFGRVRKTVALFQDTHFSIGAKQTLSPIMIPIQIVEIRGKFFVAARFPKLISLLAEDESDFNGIDLGDEVVSIDGVPTAQARDALLPYISGSSDAARKLDATAALTQRRFAFPDNPTTVLEFRDDKGNSMKLKFPWFYNTLTRADQRRFFSDRNYLSDNQLHLTWDEDKKKWKSGDLTTDNPDFLYALPPLAGQAVYKNSDGEAIVKSGYLVRNGKAYAVLQLNAFDERTVVDASGATLKFLDVARNFIKDAETAGTSLILDLRNNPGGMASYPQALFSMLTEKNKTYPNYTEAYRVTRFAQEVNDENQGQTPTGEEITGLSRESLRKLLEDAVRSGDELTAAYSNGDITADSTVGGFSQKIVALISPNCVSSCDIASILLKSSGRAVFVGQPTNGTGGGFIGSDGTSTRWSDPYQILSGKIPTDLFGLPGGPAGAYIFPGQEEALNTENRPTTPKVYYEQSIDDVLKGGQGWINKAIEVLESKDGTPVANSN